MSRHNRERRLLWKLGLAKKQTGRKATHDEIRAAKAQHPLTRRIR